MRSRGRSYAGATFRNIVSTAGRGAVLSEADEGSDLPDLPLLRVPGDQEGPRHQGRGDRLFRDPLRVTGEVSEGQEVRDPRQGDVQGFILGLQVERHASSRCNRQVDHPVEELGEPP